MTGLAKKAPEFDRSWQDAFGTVLASLELGSRKRHVLIVAASETCQSALEAMAGIAFPGRIVLAILEHLHAAPLEAVLRDQAPHFVIALEPVQTGMATHGPAIHGDSSLETASTGLEYVEPGSYPAWSSRPAHANTAQATDPQTPSTTASVASSLNFPCLVCNPSDLKTALERGFQT